MDTNAKLLTIGQFAALHGINKKHSCGMTKSDFLSPPPLIRKTDTAAIITIKAPFLKQFCC